MQNHHASSLLRKQGHPTASVPVAASGRQDAYSRRPCDGRIVANLAITAAPPRPSTLTLPSIPEAKALQACPPRKRNS
jgi:hypothetical protein